MLFVDKVLDVLDPYIAEIIFTVLTTYFGWAIRLFFASKASQDNLHLALETGVDLVTDRLADAINGGSIFKGTQSNAIAEVVAYVKGSVPGSIKTLKASERQLEKMAKAKINGRVAWLASALK